MEQFRDGSLSTVAAGSLVYAYDFLQRKRVEKPDAHTQGLKVYKRDLQWWLNFFAGFDLIDFRLGSSDAVNHGIDSVDTNAVSDSDRWEFAALFRKL